MSDPLTPSREVVVGTRGSALAMVQTDWVVSRLERLAPELRVRVEIIKTEGDTSDKAPLWQIGGKGIFVKEIEQALAVGRIDFAVHSMKDLPSMLPVGLVLAAVPEREDPRDVCVSRYNLRIRDLPAGARVGTSSSRRRAQLLTLRPDLEILSLRGNVDTRLRKAEGEDFDAIVLAAAGLARLGFLGRVTEYLDPSDCLPAIGQGALAIQARADDLWLLERLARLDHGPARAEAEAERAFLAEMGGGCELPMAALARVAGGAIELEAMVSSLDGVTSMRAKKLGEADRPAEIGTGVALDLKSRGAMELLEDRVGR